MRPEAFFFRPKPLDDHQGAHSMALDPMNEISSKVLLAVRELLEAELLGAPVQTDLRKLATQTMGSNARPPSPASSASSRKSSNSEE
jgi:hypothetical protein